MKKILKIVKNNIFGFILGAIIFSLVGAYAATTLSSSSVYYDNSNSGGSSNTVSGAIDELYEKSVTHCPDGHACVPLIVAAYTYNQTKSASNYCITGDEDTCVKTTCYKNLTSGSCPAGTIIDFYVKDEEKVRFHVMYDNGTTLTLQSQKNIVSNVVWTYSLNNREGPTIILQALESVTNDWNNVNDQTYTMGTTVFKTNAYTGCSAYNSCTTNKYTLDTRTAKARMITVQEAANLGCTGSQKSCPIWMYNYLYNSISYGGTADGTNENYGYWPMNCYATNSVSAWGILNSGYLSVTLSDSENMGARAVVEINK